MADSPDTPTAVVEAPPSDDTARYAPLLGTDERVLVVRRRHWFSLAEGARWFFLAVGIAIVIEVINGIVPNGKPRSRRHHGRGVRGEEAGPPRPPLISLRPDAAGKLAAVADVKRASQDVKTWPLR